MIYLCTCMKFTPRYMNKLQIIILFFVVLFLGVACQEQNHTRDGDLVISGKLTNGASAALFLEELTPNDIIPVDSIYADANGNFKHVFFLEDAGFYRLGIHGGNFITLSAEPGEQIFITADASDLAATYEVKGSKGSQILHLIGQKKMEGIQHANQLRELYRDSRGRARFPEIRDSLRQEYQDIKEEQRRFVIQIIEQNPDNLASILALYQYFEDHVLLREDQHFEYFEKLSKTLCNSYASNKHVIDLKKRVSDRKREEQQRLQNEENLAIGRLAPEIVLPTPEGNTVSLSSLRGNIVLIDFWAAWCPPCRVANVKLGELYSKYKGRGFEIYGVSLDRTRDQWIQAIEVDNITWVQVSDLRFMNSPVVNLYNVVEIPYTVLLDREGRIIARNFSVDELEALLLQNL